MNNIRKVSLVADVLIQSKDWQLRAMGWELRDRVKQQPTLTKQEALSLLKRAERAVAVAAAWEATRPRR